MKIGAYVPLRLASPLGTAGTRLEPDLDRPASLSGRDDDLALRFDRLRKGLLGGNFSSSSTKRGDVAPAEPAELEILAGAGGLAATSATLLVESSSGRLLVEIEEGQSLAEIARQINRQSGQSGISATAASDKLVLSTTDVGRNASLRIEQVTGGEVEVRGVNGRQVSQFAVLSPPSASEVVAGSLLSTARRATLRYLGDEGGLVASDATFLLRGTLGKTTIEITAGESLASVAARINARTSITGVTAQAAGNDLLLHSEATGYRASIQIQLLSGEYETTTDGINSSQIAEVEVLDVEPGTHVLGGEVLQTATHGELTLQGGTGGVVIDGATFELRGATGSAIISMAAGESLRTVANRVNSHSGTTGVTAEVLGDDLVFRTVGVGSAATVAAELLSVDHHLTISGTNSQQLTGFSVPGFTDGATQTLSGSVTQAAGTARLTFTSKFSNFAGTTAAIAVTGNTGTAFVSVDFLDTLQTVANRINAQTATTGVSATVEGSNLHFHSTGVGTSSFVNVQAASGTFDVTGGDGNGLDYGIDAVAVINGQSVTANGNDFSFSDALGSYAFTAVQGFTGTISPITIESRPGQFGLTGGSGDGTASGLDATAVINGIQLTGAGNRFAINDAGGRFELEFQPGFTGAFDSVTIHASLVKLNLDGVNSAGRAVGRDAIAVINGQRLLSSGSRFTVAGRQGAFAIDFAEGFTGAFDPITIVQQSGDLQVVGAKLGETVHGRDARRGSDDAPSDDGKVSAAGRFQIAQHSSRWLYKLAENDPEALRRIFREPVQSDFERRQWIAAFLI